MVLKQTLVNLKFSAFLLRTYKLIFLVSFYLPFLPVFTYNMAMMIYKCKMCDGALDVHEGDTVAVCKYFGTWLNSNQHINV